MKELKLGILTSLALAAGLIAAAAQSPTYYDSNALDYSMNVFTSVMKGLNVYPKRMKQNMEITRGLLFSQRVLLALIDKGMSRQSAYKIVQRSAMKTWQSDTKKFINLLKADSEVTAVLSLKELEALFDYNYYLRFVDDVFRRLGLTDKQWIE